MTSNTSLLNNLPTMIRESAWTAERCLRQTEQQGLAARALINLIPLLAAQGGELESVFGSEVSGDFGGDHESQLHPAVEF